MRKVFALVAAAAIGLLAACSSQPTSTDPYQVVDQATHATYGDLVQANLGLDVAGSQPVHVDPSAIQLVVDTKAGKADVAVSVPMDALQIDAATRSQLGLTGDSLDLDIRYDGTALYTKSPLLAPMLTALVAGSGSTPGDYSGWVRLGTTAELAALVGGLVPQVSIPPLASAGAQASHDAASLKQDLETAGITLTFVGREQRAGQDVDHLSASLDVSKLESSPMASELPASQLTQVEDALGQADLAADLWFAADSHRLTEVDLTATPKATTNASPASSAGDKVSFVLLISTPKDASALAGADKLHRPAAGTHRPVPPPVLRPGPVHHALTPPPRRPVTRRP